jgi:hypothetical protein
MAAASVTHTARGHEVITTKLTWSKEVSRIVYARCAQCHRPQGAAFSLLHYAEARPWAKAIQEQVLTRQMPPWNAVKGFGDFSPDHGLSQEEIATISSWVEGGAPEGDANHLPPLPRLAKPVPKLSGPTILIRRALQLPRALRIAAIEPVGIPPGASAKLVATLPDGEIMPLIWIRDYSPKATAQYRLAEPLRLPRGARLEARGEGGFRLRLPM